MSYAELKTPSLGLGVFSCLISLEHHGEGFRWDVDFAEALHAGFTLLLLFEEFGLAVTVTSVNFDSHVLAISANRLARDDFGADCCLQSHFKVLARNDGFEFLVISRPSASASER